MKNHDIPPGADNPVPPPEGADRAASLATSRDADHPLSTDAERAASDNDDASVFSGSGSESVATAVSSTSEPSGEPATIPAPLQYRLPGLWGVVDVIQVSWDRFEEQFRGRSTGATVPVWSDDNTLLVEDPSPRELDDLKDANFTEMEMVEKQINELIGGRVILLGRARTLADLHATQLEDIVYGEEGKRSRRWSAEELANKELLAEVAIVLHTSDHNARTLVAEADNLTEHLPQTLDGLCKGELSHKNAGIIAKEAKLVPVEDRGDFESRLVPAAKKLSPPKLQRKAHDLRERLHPETMKQAHEEALTKRNVWIEPNAHGMATLTAYLPATECLGIYNRITETAISLQGPDEDRSLGQLRADVLTDLAINAIAEGPYNKGIQASVAVFVEATTLLKHNDNPATLAGFGPIDANAARQIAAECPAFTRILTDPVTFAVLDVGRKKYPPTEEQRMFLQVRDATCMDFGCNRAAKHCDIDHTVEWRYGGKTHVDNLKHLCPSHHALKTFSGWESSQRTGGHLTYITATGRSVDVEPAILVQPPDLARGPVPDGTVVDADTAPSPETTTGSGIVAAENAVVPNDDSRDDGAAVVEATTDTPTGTADDDESLPF